MQLLIGLEILMKSLQQTEFFQRLNKNYVVSSSCFTITYSFKQDKRQFVAISIFA